MASLNWLDYTILGIVLLSTLTGILRGFIKELIALCIWVLAIWLAYHYANHFDGFFQGWVEDARLRYGIGFIVIMVGTLIIGGIGNTFLGFILKKSGLSTTDRILGMGFGLLRGAFIVSLVLVVIQMTSLAKQESVNNSQLASQFDPIVKTFKSYIPSLIQRLKSIDSNNQLAAFDQSESLLASDEIIQSTH
ncbi:CvpA family protein [Legionella sp. W05-934-2]|jgi:membrane protein required for colicin V production|uniref:CvpA family protein n=1 Tax=Legionella sp. W05-934-2 TaxID=1198649 RepID=UPI0034631A93